jgi:flagellar hook protein FlgE
MSDAILSGVSGLLAHQTMLDVAGDNLANVNTYGYKASRVTFSELLAQTMREATQPTATVGGTNPEQVGGGVRVASIDRNMSQGNMVSTGQPLDMAIQGNGYFTLNNGQQDVYTRVGNFAVDANYYLVDPSTGYRVQRVGSEGVAEGFQNPSSGDIRIPYDVALPAKSTSTVTFHGNLSADSTTTATTNRLTSGVGSPYTDSKAIAGTDTLITGLDQATGVAAGDTISITGTARDGTAVNAAFTIAANSTLGDLTAAITSAFSGSTASITNGEIRLVDNSSGYSKTDLNLGYTGGGSFKLPANFTVLEAGGEETSKTNVQVYDAQGTSHVLSVSFVRSTTPNSWDAVLTSCTGDVSFANRRVSGITFGADGSYGGLTGGGTASFGLRYSSGGTQEVGLNLGTSGGFDGLSQFGGASTAAASGQDGYQAGKLSSLSVNQDGTLVGMFTNGVRENIATLQLATFQNAAGLQSTNGGFFMPSANSGDPVPTKAQSGGAGTVQGASLEKSNVDMASEFVNLIEAQNGYQANARTIRTANDMLSQLATLMR